MFCKKMAKKLTSDLRPHFGHAFTSNERSEHHRPGIHHVGKLDKNQFSDFFPLRNLARSDLVVSRTKQCQNGGQRQLSLLWFYFFKSEDFLLPHFYKYIGFHCSAIGYAFAD